MAKGNFLTSTVRGKLGEMVGYKNTNSNDKVKQAWRAYIPHISNPKTEGQARQRMIVSNLTQNYTALKEIISRAFEGIKYGGKSYNRFLSLNMKNAGQGPFIPKGTRSTPLPIPGMQLSEGSLITINVDGIRDLSVGDTGTTLIAHLLKSDIYVDNTFNKESPTATFGDLSRAIINGNTDIHNGDQLTFVSVSVTENLEYVYRYKSIILDIDSTEVLGTPQHDTAYRSYDGIYFWVSSVSEGRFFAFSLVDVDFDEVNVAGCVIQSRKGGDGKWLRSAALLWVNTNDEEIMQYFSAEMFQTALESYMGIGSGTNSDWPTEPDPETTAPAALVVAPYHFVQDTIDQTLNCQFVSRGNEQLMVVATVDGTDYPLDPLGHILAYNETLIEARNATPVIGTIKRSDLAALGL